MPIYKKDGLIFSEYAQIDMAIAQENMWLEADSIGLGGVWLGIAPDKGCMDAVKEVLELSEDYEPFSLFPLGYPAEERCQQDRFDESRIHYM